MSIQTSRYKHARTRTERIGTKYGYTGNLSEELIAFAKRQLVNATLYKGDLRRQDERHPLMTPVLVVPVNESNQPIGDAIEVISRDVGTNSIGLIHAEHMNYERVAIQLKLSGTEVFLVVDLKWREPMGPFYGSGGVYVEKLDRFPSHLDLIDDRR